MNKVSSHRKEATHERIVDTAARAIRRCGYDGISVVDLMKEAGLTHGGFYAHFDSREAMLAEAADRAGAELVARFLEVASRVPSDQSLQAFVQAYLSKEHFDHPEVGCPIAALGSEMPRQAPSVRRVITSRIKELIDAVCRKSPHEGKPGCQEHALAIAATMIGAMTLARAVDDGSLSDSILDAARQHLVPSCN